MRTDVPVVAYQMLPYGGGAAAVTGATLLLPTTAWDTNYIAANAYGNPTSTYTGGPSLDVVAAEDGTSVTILPKAAIAPGVGMTGWAAGSPVTFQLDAGQALQFTQGTELTGSPIQSDKPIGLWGGHQCTNTPGAIPYCDHAETQIPAVRALGSEYVGVSYRPRTSVPENPLWRLVGAVDGTVLHYEPAVGGPATIGLGEMMEFATDTPFVVRSQDAQHPFLLLSYMTGADSVRTQTQYGYGDPDVARVVPPAQFLKRYVFFTDPTYPETNLVVVRKKGDGGFANVWLDCAGDLSGFKPVGSQGLYEWTRTDLIRHNFQPQGDCTTGRREMTSTEPFGVTVWGWGSPETQPNPDPEIGSSCVEFLPNYSCYVSYAYPAGEGLASLSDIVVPPVPK
jgi:hypothetical protein